MANVWVNGFLVDQATGQPLTTTSTVGAQWSFGFLRAPDGKLVVVYR
jgi:hypothetical protein